MIKLFKRSIKRKTKEERVERALKSILSLEEKEPTPKIETRVACVQRQIKPVKKVDEFIYEMYLFTKEAASNGAQYIVFPEYNFFDLFGLLPGFRKLNNSLNKRASDQRKQKDSSEEGSSNNFLYDLFYLFARPSERVLLTTMKELAQHFNMYIYTGTYIYLEKDHLYNRGTLIDPEGKIIAHQDKVHLTDFEAEIGLKRKNHFEVVSLPIGNVAIPVCMDASYFETFQVITASKAEIVMLPIANNESYNKWRAMRGIWGRVQESYVYGLKASLNGSIGGLEFTGKAGIFAPINMTENEDGIVALAENPIGDELIIADLDLELLMEARNNAPYFGDRNEDFEREFYENTYVKGE